MHQPTTSENDSSFAQNARRAQDLRNKAQQLAVDELSIMNHAVGLNLLAKQLADATMRPRPALAPAGLPLSFFLSNGMSNPLQQQALQVQLRAQALAGAAHDGLQILDAAAAAGLAKQQQAAVDQQQQQDCELAVVTRSADGVQSQQQQLDTNSTLAAAQEPSGSIRQPQYSHDAATACMDVAVGPDPVKP